MRTIVNEFTIIHRTSISVSLGSGYMNPRGQAFLVYDFSKSNLPINQSNTIADLIKFLGITEKQWLAKCLSC